MAFSFSTSAPLLAWATKAKDIPIASADMEVATQTLWIVSALVLAFFVLRPELWRRLWFDRLDPRPAALTRIALGLTALWTMADLLIIQGEWLFTDQGLLTTELARKNYGGQLRKLWHPEHGFASWTDFFKVFTDRWTVLHVRSDPPFVWGVAALFFVSATMMTLGWYTRVSSVLTWVLILQLYNYNPIYYAGGDTVHRVFLFLGMFVDWGQAYSVDAWRRRRRAILGGAEHLPALKRIAAWPVRLFMIQLACIYCATGLLKSGKTWADGTALYYAMNLDHFYRVPMHLATAWMHKLYITRVLTWVVHWWEILFPLVFVGEILRGYDRDRDSGRWQGPVPRWTLYGLALAGTVLLVWQAPLWLKTAPLFVLAALIFTDRRLLGPADTSGRGPLSWTIRVLSWLCLIGVLVAGTRLVDIGVSYYFKAGSELPAEVLEQQRALVRTLTQTAMIAVPLFAAALLVSLRRWTPRAYRVVRDWLLGKRLWLTMGFFMHVGIDLTMNVGTFVQVMVAVYPIWLRGEDIDAMWRYLLSRPARPGEGGRPSTRMPVLRWLVAPFERARYRVPREPWVVLHSPEADAIRRAALLRCWDLGQRLRFELDDTATPQRPLTLRAPTGQHLEGAQAGRRLIALLPGLWWLWPISAFPGVGRLAAKILRQRA